MGAAFVFFMSERNNVAPEYRTTMTISALIVGIAAFHYYYMRGVYVDTQVVAPNTHMDWSSPSRWPSVPFLVGKDATDKTFADSASRASASWAPSSRPASLPR